MNASEIPEMSHVKRSYETHRRKSSGLCPCGAKRHNPNDGYCRTCRAAASLASYHRRQDELKRLRALEKQLLEGKEHDGSE